MMNRHHIKGLEVTLPGAPVQAISAANTVTRVGVFARDYPQLRPDLMVAEGDSVAQGAPLFVDRKHREIHVVAPISGKITKIETRAKRRLSHIEITRDEAPARIFDIAKPASRADIVSLCLNSGLWCALQQRPFGRIPDPATVPAAILATALETGPYCADASVVLAQFDTAFGAGLQGLRKLTEGPVFVCQGNGAAVAEADNQIRITRFTGTHPAGLPGTHLDRLGWSAVAKPVWQVNYQDVIALGRLLTTGILPEARIVALAGPGVRNPRLVSLPAGAALDEVLAGELADGQFVTLSGCPLSGAESGHLRHRSWQISVLPRSDIPRRRPRNTTGGWWQRRMARRRPAPVIPTQALSLALGPRLNVVPMLRALSVGDIEMADRLGCRALLEEDMALLTYVTGGETDFAALLRQVLDVLEQQA